ncbi:hypothetical protein ABEB36_004526 [Hypothenemus hampei]
MLKCKQAGRKIATVNSADEQSLLKSAIVAYGINNPIGYWIGAGAESYQTNFYWIQTGVKLTYANWGTSQQNYSGHTSRKLRSRRQLLSC